MPVEDKLIAMHARHAIAKTPLDISELVISCNKGVVELNGKVKRPRNFIGQINVPAEFRVIQDLVRTAHGVKDIVTDRVELQE